MAAKKKAKNTKKAAKPQARKDIKAKGTKAKTKKAEKEVTASTESLAAAWKLSQE